MPVNAKINAHVVADKNNAPRAELDCQVKGVKPAVAAPTNLTEPIKQESVAVANQRYEVQPPLRVWYVAVLADLQPFERGRPRFCFPPIAVAGVEGVGPWAELVSVVDGEDFGASSRCVNSCRGCAWPTGNDDRCASTPVGPPGWAKGRLSFAGAASCLAIGNSSMA